MSSVAAQIDAGKGTGEREVATGVYINDTDDLILSIGRRTVFVDETGIRIVRKDGDILILDDDVQVYHFHVIYSRAKRKQARRNKVQ